MVEWKEYTGQAFRGRFPARIIAHVRDDPRDTFDSVHRFCEQHFGRLGERWSWFCVPSEYDHGRLVLAKMIVGFATEADMIFFMTGVDR